MPGGGGFAKLRPMQIRFDDTAGAARLVSVEQVAGGPVAVQVNEDVPDEFLEILRRADERTSEKG